MALSPEQLGRLRARFPTLSVRPTCTLIDSHFDEHVTLGEGVSICRSRIGAKTCVGENVSIAQARIGNSVMIGAGAKIDPKVTIGNDAVIPPGAQVTRDVDAHAYAPSPDLDNDLPLEAFLLEKLPQSNIFQKWSDARGDETLRLDYPLTSDSLVVDAGGYQGDFAHDMSSRYGCRVEIFEPVGEFAGQIGRRFSGNRKIRTNECGLAATNRDEQIALAAESSSHLTANVAGQTQTIHLRAAAEVLRHFGQSVDLLKINIEGAEYELLDHLLDQDLVGDIRYLQIQFHNFVPDAAGRRRDLRARLRITHVEQYNYPFIWESWARRK